VVSEIEVLPESYLAGKTLAESRPWDHGVIVLAIRRNEMFTAGLPGPADVIQVGDVLTSYGQEASLRALVEPDSKPETKAEVGAS
jgi:uncharacterized protein with PhoU and TrkA domain